MNATAIATATGAKGVTEVQTYICACEIESTVPAKSGLPAGWERREVEQASGGMQMAILCPDCARFESFMKSENDRLHTEEQRTHDSSSAIDDEPSVPTAKSVSQCQRDWQIIATFHTDKGILETSTTVTAANPLAAIDELEVRWSRISEMFALTVVPAPLAVN